MSIGLALVIIAALVCTSALVALERILALKRGPATISTEEMRGALAEVERLRGALTALTDKVGILEVNAFGGRK